MEYEEYYLEQQPNKPVFPSGDTNEDGFLGISYREYLIGQLCANPKIVDTSHIKGIHPDDVIAQNAIDIINQADAIIDLLVEERKKK